jgi:hypothetical protein
MSRNAVGPPGERWWPATLPGADLDYTDTLDAVQAQGDSVASAALAIAPSGTGERQVLDLAINGYVLTAQLTGGVRGRVYRNEITITGVSGRIYQYVIRQLIRVADAVPPAPFWIPPPPPSPGFGTPIIWSGGVTVFGAAIVAVAANLTLTVSPLPMVAQTNIITSAPSGTYGILPATVVSGTIVVQNNDPINAASIKPPAGAQISYGGTLLAVNAPFLIQPNGQRISFVTNAASLLWMAG